MKNIGFIGTGLMGFPMAKNLLKSGFKLKAFNRSIEKAEPLRKFGAEISESIKEVVNNCDVIITMLTDDVAVDEVMKNPDFLKNIKTGATVIDMSSVKPKTALTHGENLKSKNINEIINSFLEDLIKNFSNEKTIYERENQLDAFKTKIRPIMGNLRLTFL